MNDNNILAVVLAGGQSKRFGEDKNQVKLGNITLLEHVLAKVTNKFEKILIILTPILSAHSSTFLKLLFTKSFSRVSINLTDHSPNILCLF